MKQLLSFTKYLQETWRLLCKSFPKPDRGFYCEEICFDIIHLPGPGCRRIWIVRSREVIIGGPCRLSSVVTYFLNWATKSLAHYLPEMLRTSTPCFGSKRKKQRSVYHLASCPDGWISRLFRGCQAQRNSELSQKFLVCTAMIGIRCKLSLNKLTGNADAR